MMGNVAQELKAIRAALKQGEAEQQTVSTTEAARALGVSTRRLAQLMRAGELASAVVGGSRRIPISEVQRLSLR